MGYPHRARCAGFAGVSGGRSRLPYMYRGQPSGGGAPCAKRDRAVGGAFAGSPRISGFPRAVPVQSAVPGLPLIPGIRFRLIAMPAPPSVCAYRNAPAEPLQTRKTDRSLSKSFSSERIKKPISPSRASGSATPSAARDRPPVPGPRSPPRCCGCRRRWRDGRPSRRSCRPAPGRAA